MVDFGYAFSVFKVVFRGHHLHENTTSFKTGQSTEREKLEVEYVSQIKLIVTLLNVY